jgi:hypothetical protein
MTNLSFPKLKGDETAFEIVTEGKTVKLSHEECLDKMEAFSKAFNLEYTNIINSAPIHYPVNLTLGLLGSISNKNYTVIPGTYNFSDSLKLLITQKAPMLICEEDLLDNLVNSKNITEMKSMTKDVKDVVIFANSSSKKKDMKTLGLFDNANFTYYDEFTFNKLN